MKRHCGNCNFNDEAKFNRRGMVQCLCTDQWHKYNYDCVYWQLYDATLSRYERLKLVRDFENKKKEHSRYLKNITYSSFFTVLGGIAIFLLIFVVVMIAYALINILK